jgi:hypothetical protein
MRKVATGAPFKGALADFEAGGALCSATDPIFFAAYSPALALRIGVMNFVGA